MHGLFLDFFLTTSSALCSDQQQAVTAWEPPDPEEKCCVTIEVGNIVKLREREGQGVDPGRSLKGHL